MAPLRTRPPGGPGLVALYDGSCRICTAGARSLRRWGRRGAVELQSFQEPGALDRFPGLSFEECMKRLYVVAPDGQVFGAAEAVARVLATIPILGLLADAYYLPGLRQLAEWIYVRVAERRYRLGKTVACDDGTCALHEPSPR